MTTARSEDFEFMKIAIDEAERGRDTGGIPIGAALVIDGKVVGRGHNRRVQDGSPILHGEMSALENAGRLKASDYKRATMYTTLSPCEMCSGTILLYKIPRVVLAENTSFQGAEHWLSRHGVDVVNLDLPEAKSLMQEFMASHPQIWNEDIGI